jgi:hypothetical protein
MTCGYPTLIYVAGKKNCFTTWLKPKFLFQHVLQLVVGE